MKQIILVTGSHRSGTTWVGRVIASAKKIKYVHEPFNIGVGRKFSPFSYWFQYVSNSTPENAKLEVKQYLDWFCSTSLKVQFYYLTKIGQVGGLRTFLGNWKSKLLSKAILLKDPIAVMSIPWMSTTYNAKVVFMVRHPAAFVASLKVKHWTFDFNNFLEQEGLMKEQLNSYTKEIEKFVNEPQDIIQQGVLLWNIIHSQLLKYQEQDHPLWYFVKHEDVSRNPLCVFEALFDFLDLEFSTQVITNIEDTSKASETGYLHRDSKDNISSWKQRLTSEEIKTIKEGTQAVWPAFYNETDW